MQKLIKQLLKFGVVGIIAFFIDYGTMMLFTEVVGINYLVSSALSFTISVIFNYIASIKFVFEVGHKQTFKDAMIFIGLSIVGLIINEIIMFYGVDKLFIDYKITKIGATAIVMVFNFITRKIFIEK